MTVALERRVRPEPPPIPRARRRAKTTTRRTDLGPGDRASAWRIDRELGKGGMATVYAVTHTRFGKRAALKLAHRSILTETFTADTFLREARIANMIDHPSVPDVFATGSYDTRPYLIMERLVGRTLGERLEAGPPMTRLQAIDLLLELCDVLGVAHAAGVVHRDLKLDNVFVLDAPCAGGRHVKLLDWGVATILGEPDPLQGMIAGTLTYVAPEQIGGGDITPATDIYSLAVLAYQVLFGQPPFTSRSDLELINKHLRETPPEPAVLWPEIPAGLAWVLVAMLAKDPTDRPLLAEIVAVLEQARHALVAPPVRRSWLRIPAALATVRLDVLGRPALAIPVAHRRVIGATLAVLITLASLGSALL